MTYRHPCRALVEDRDDLTVCISRFFMNFPTCSLRENPTFEVSYFSRGLPYLVSTSAPENQEAYAVILSGAKVTPFIVEAAKCEKSCGDKDHFLLGHVLREMGPVGIYAAVQVGVQDAGTRF